MFSISDIRKRRNWGGAWGRWSSPYTPEILIPYFLSSAKTITIDVYLQEIKVASLTKESDKGFNEASFDLSFSKKGRKLYMSTHKEALLKEAKNGIYYLPKGAYTVKIESATSMFNIK